MNEIFCKNCGNAKKDKIQFYNVAALTIKSEKIHFRCLKCGIIFVFDFEKVLDNL